MSARPLTRRQQDVLFVVSQNAPLTVRDGYYRLPGFTEAGMRSALRCLEARGLLARQYTGLRYGVRGTPVAYVLSPRGREVLAALDLDPDYDPTQEIT